MSSIVFDKERSNKSFSYWPSFSVLAEFFLYWPTFSRIGRVCSVLGEFVISMMLADFAIQMLYL